VEQKDRGKETVLEQKIEERRQSGNKKIGEKGNRGAIGMGKGAVVDQAVKDKIQLEKLGPPHAFRMAAALMQRAGECSL
jgi:hypothetical protein